TSKDLVTLLVQLDGANMLKLVIGIALVGCVVSVIMSRRELSAPNAVCNNGEQAVYYVQDDWPGPEQNVMIYLQGGGLCIDDLSCTERCIESPSLCEPLEDAEMERTEGIFSTNSEINPAFHNYYKVFVPYCSSDIYSGDKEAEDDLDFHFRGYQIINAIREDLEEHIDLGEAENVILSGGSAGGMGVMRHCDEWAEALPRAGVKCIPDSGTFSPHNLAPAEEGCSGIGGDFDFAGTRAYWNASVATNCYNGRPGSHEEKTRDCSFNSIAYKYVQSPLFMATYKFDSFFAAQWCYPGCGDENRPSYHDRWDEAMNEIANELRTDYNHVGLFMPSCWGHVLNEGDDSYSQFPAGSEGLTYNQAVNNWMTGTGSRHAVDECGALCNNRCGGDNC
ncbi:unnamed protein product, partial [Owenia fusiformis]